MSAEFPIDWPIKNDLTAIMVAASTGSLDALKIVMSKNPDINIVDNL
jgi:hypothetical protein